MMSTTPWGGCRAIWISLLICISTGLFSNLSTFGPKVCGYTGTFSHHTVKNRVTDLTQLSEALTTAIATPGPALVEVPTDASLL